MLHQVTGKEKLNTVEQQIFACRKFSRISRISAKELDWVWLAYIRKREKPGLLSKTCIFYNTLSQKIGYSQDKECRALLINKQAKGDLNSLVKISSQKFNVKTL